MFQIVKKPSSYLFLSFCLAGCQMKPESHLTSDRPMFSDSKQPLSLSSPWPDSYDLNPKVNTQAYVEALEPKISSPQLRYPMDLAVSKDGSTLYVLNRNCGSLDAGYVSRPFYGERYWFGSATQPSFLNPRQTIDCAFAGVSQKLIYTIKDGGTLSVLTIKGQAPFPLQLGEDLETDQDSNLYFTVPFTHRIYRFNPVTQDLNVVTQALTYVPIEDYHLTAVQQEPSQPRMGLLEGPVRLHASSASLFYFLGNLTSPVPSFFIERFDFLTKNRARLDKDFDRFNLPIYIVNPDNDVHVTGYIPYDYVDSPNPDLLHSVSVRNSKGEIFGNDIKRSQIWKWDHQTKMRVPFAGNAEDGYKDGVGLHASFRYPMGLAVDGQNNLYVSDTGNHAIRKITPEGKVTTIYKQEFKTK